MDTADHILERLRTVNFSENKIQNVSDEAIPKQILKSFIKKKSYEELIKGLNTYQAAYLLYGRHSEKEEIRCDSPKEYGKVVLKMLKPGELRNPLVESVMRETCSLVKEVWDKYGRIDEIHVELGRELKNNSKQRELISKAQKNNFDEKLKAKKILTELLNETAFEHYDEEGNKIISGFTVKPNPDNPKDIERFRLWKDQASVNEQDWNGKVKSEKIPTEQQLKKYILWLNQNCRSPYTGKIIPLSKLFDGNEYEIEHIIPRSKMKNDAMSNLIIAERIVNKAKGNELAANFISASNGYCSYEGKDIKIFTYDEYKHFVDDTFKNNRAKRKNLLATEVPDDFIERQINDTRYIGKKLGELLRPVLAEPNNMIFTVGSITSELKDNWGLNDVWKRLLKPRFERLEKILGQKLIYEYEDEYGNKKFGFKLSVNEKLEKNGIKRLDHRHHALDAIVIAATTREHIRYLNTLNASDTNEEIRKYRLTLCKRKIRDFKPPWNNFARDVKDSLESCVISFKENTPIVTKPYNKYEKWEIKNGKPVKIKEKQIKDGNGRWLAVRKSMFKEPQGIIWIKEKRNVPVLEAFKVQIERMKVERDPEKRRLAGYVYDRLARGLIKNIIDKIGGDIEDSDRLLTEVKKYLKKNSKKVDTGKIKKNGKNEYKTVYILDNYEFENIEIAEFVEYAAKRVSLDKSFTHDKINKIPYAKEGKSPLADLLHEHLSRYNDNATEAFSGEGLEALTKKAGKRIEKVTIHEKKSPDDKFGNKYVEVDKGAIAYFIIYENETTKERPEKYSLATHKAIERLIEGKSIAEIKEGFKTIILSPNDLVYVPTEEEQKKIKTNHPSPIDWDNKKEISERIYRMVSSSKSVCQFIQHRIANAIIPSNPKEKIKGEIDWHDKSPKTMDGKFNIADCCIKIQVDRLGNIKPLM
ncbi:type II CRISPR RNA-guided endonuclease Cas9 [Melioribacter roseus]|uniref:type II CRISPR RNA-guided endonuclease Cas9 n=1 Tax=Melioribacter roseus TaxID=1134405 RepID=UPI0002FD9E89|nr:type II CRISPR RNA-guided endonuclease Cas9 [Melioribacter roseus]